jgi:hypothetical protein
MRNPFDNMNNMLMFGRPMMGPVRISFGDDDFIGRSIHHHSLAPPPAYGRRVFFISPSLNSNAHYPLVNGGLGGGGSHGFSELYRRWDSRRYPQLINGVDVNRMTPEEIYDYFVSTDTSSSCLLLD